VVDACGSCEPCCELVDGCGCFLKFPMWSMSMRFSDFAGRCAVLWRFLYLVMSLASSVEFHLGGWDRARMRFVGSLIVWICL